MEPQNGDPNDGSATVNIAGAVVATTIIATAIDHTTSAHTTSPNDVTMTVTAMGNHMATMTTRYATGAGGLQGKERKGSDERE